MSGGTQQEKTRTCTDQEACTKITHWEKPDPLSVQNMAKNICKKYRKFNEPWEDLMQIAMVGACTAVDKYDPNKGAYITIACYWMENELLNYFYKRKQKNGNVKREVSYKEEPQENEIVQALHETPTEECLDEVMMKNEILAWIEDFLSRTTKRSDTYCTDKQVQAIRTYLEDKPQQKENRWNKKLGMEKLMRHLNTKIQGVPC